MLICSGSHPTGDNVLVMSLQSNSQRVIPRLHQNKARAPSIPNQEPPGTCMRTLENPPAPLRPSVLALWLLPQGLLGGLKEMQLGRASAVSAPRQGASRAESPRTRKKEPSSPPSSPPPSALSTRWPWVSFPCQAALLTQ